ncbi:DUF4240 domain-containing protein [Streptomyces sp. NPDC096205]|uniref:DUF4240 domain-containing protein n=1 Tax=Streptomyces sp. NPDC096205 TaxID=3366081 RepID=UPI0038121DDD
MDTDEFWRLIDTARARTTNEVPFDEALVDVLTRCPKEEILAFEARFDTLHDALYRWDVWAAAYLIGGGCSDDSFMDFRAGLIAQGRTWYERACASPDVLADHPEVVAVAAEDSDEALFHEEVNYAADDAYEQLTGDPDAFDKAYDDYLVAHPEAGGSNTGTPAGEDFDFDDDAEMHHRLPRLSALFLGHLEKSA